MGTSQNVDLASKNVDLPAAFEKVCDAVAEAGERALSIGECVRGMVRPSTKRQTLKRESADVVLVRAVCAEEAGAWETFIRRFSDLIYSYCADVFSPDELENEYLAVVRRFQSDKHKLLHGYN